jgi:SAM-dependent methyltransferase
MTVTTVRQSTHNATTWARNNFVRSYTGTNLSEAEEHILETHRDALRGRVLELGCGAGRVTGYLIEHSDRVHAIDISPAMIEFCARTYPGGTFTVADLRDMSSFATGSADAVVAIANVLDILDHDERLRVLEEIARILAPGGTLVMSSHNRAYAERIPKPTQIRGARLRARVKSALSMPRRVLNHRRLAPLERHEDEYAILNDEAHRYSLLHYYIDPAAQARQFDALGFTLLESLDRDANVLADGEAAPGCAEIFYVARAPLAGANAHSR